MRELVVARHAESELNVENVLNGDPALDLGLTDLGESQARTLGELAGPVELVAHTRFERTRRTAELAWPATRLLEVRELDEIRFGRFEGTRWGEGYEAWVSEAGPGEACPGGGESRVEAATRYVRGLRLLLGRPEERLALVAHGAPIRYLLLGAEGAAPTAVLLHVPPAEPFLLGREAVERACTTLERWLAAPASW